jgi:hypothetical protein
MIAPVGMAGTAMIAAAGGKMIGPAGATARIMTTAAGAGDTAKIAAAGATAMTGD